MENIKIHLITETDTLKSISHQYNCSLENLLLLNPMLKYQDLKLGQIIYVSSEERNIIPPFNINTIQDNLYKIKDLNKKSFISYTNKFNDYILIESELFDNYRNLSNKIFENTNDQLILYNHLKLMHDYYLTFANNLIQRNEKEINTTKQKIKEQTLNIYKYLNSKKIKFDLKQLTSLVEERLLTIVKIINGNYYDIYK